MPIKEWKDFEDSYRQHMLVTYALHRLPVEDQVRALNEALGNWSKGVELRVLAYLSEVEDPTLNGPKPLSRSMMGWLVMRACYPDEANHAASQLLEGLARTGEGGEELERLLEAAVSQCEQSLDEEIWMYTGFVLREVKSPKLASFLERVRSHPSAAIRGILEYFV